jgi:predicted transcriptional regulator
MSKSLKELGWSQEKIAYVIGCTRPALLKYLKNGDGLNLETATKLQVLMDKQVKWKAFEREAVANHAFHSVWKPAYDRLMSTNKTRGGSDD